MNLNEKNDFLRLEIVSLKENLFSGKVKYVVLPGIDGELGIFPKHTPLITKIKPGTLKFENSDSSKEELFFVAGGILEVQPSVVTVLADTAIRGEEIDEEKALSAKNKAEEIMKNNIDKISLATAQAELAVAVAELATLRKLRGKK